MKVLWITNILFPDICEELNLPIPVIGGWMKSSAAAIQYYHPDVEFAIASPYLGGELFCKHINGITYYCLPTQKHKYDKKLEDIWRKIYNEYQPDIIHLHGTEYAHGLAYLHACGANNTLISIQGLVSCYARYEAADIKFTDYSSNASLRHILKGEFTMAKQGKYEIQTLQIGKYFIGRTEWDKAHIWAVNPEAKYYFCNETLRKPFYQAQWDVNACERYRIFLSQAAHPIKGLHKVLLALPLILSFYPDTIIYVTGNNLQERKGIIGRLKTTTYSNIIRTMIRRLGLQKHIVFLGSLDEKEMMQQYLKAHVFICPSSIENSPNSLGEAQLVGTPCIASYVGGVANMVEHRKTGMLYRFEEHEMLAKYVCEIFADESLAKSLSANERVAAHLRHNEKINADRTYEIYNTILD